MKRMSKFRLKLLIVRKTANNGKLLNKSISQQLNEVFRAVNSAGKTYEMHTHISHKQLRINR